MDVEEFRNTLYAIKGWHPTGSNYICNPPVIDTDMDFIVLIKDEDYFDTIGRLSLCEWELGGSDPTPVSEAGYENADYGFASWKKGNVNLIITTSQDFYNKFVYATEVAKRQNLLKKEDRVALFQKILYGNNTTLWQAIKNYFSP